MPRTSLPYNPAVLHGTSYPVILFVILVMSSLLTHIVIMCKINYLQQSQNVLGFYPTIRKLIPLDQDAERIEWLVEIRANLFLTCIEPKDMVPNAFSCPISFPFVCVTVFCKIFFLYLETASLLCRVTDTALPKSQSVLKIRSTATPVTWLSCIVCQVGFHPFAVV